VILAAAVVVLLLVDVQWKPGHQWWAVAAGLGLAGATAAVALQWIDYRGDAGASFFSDMIAVDGFGAFAGMVIFPLAGLSLMGAWPLVRAQGGRGAEFVVLVLIAASGAHLMAASLHLIASIPNALFLEFVVWDSPLAHDLVQPRFWIEKDGAVPVPEGPGLGITLDEAVLRRYRVA